MRLCWKGLLWFRIFVEASSIFSQVSLFCVRTRSPEPLECKYRETTRTLLSSQGFFKFYFLLCWIVLYWLRFEEMKESQCWLGIETCTRLPSTKLCLYYLQAIGLFGYSRQESRWRQCFAVFCFKSYYRILCCALKNFPSVLNREQKYPKER